jgi:exodeoxyribonuclease VII small subunit
MSEMTFREIMERLEEITSVLEKEDLELEEGLRLFEEGVGLIREARQRLGSASSKVDKLRRNSTGLPRTGYMDL